MSRSTGWDVTKLRNIKALIKENEEALDLIIPNLAFVNESSNASSDSHKSHKFRIPQTISVFRAAW